MTIVTPGVIPASVLAAEKPSRWLDTFARFARATRYDDLPATVVARTKLVILDCIGATLAGRSEPEVAAATLRLAKTMKARKSGSPLLAAFLDGTAGTMLEIDEGNQYARGHPGIHVVPAVLAIGPARRATGRDAIVATTLGYEISARIGIASKLRVTMHPHGTWGTVGAALAVAKLSKAKVDDFRSVINVASSLGLATSRRTMLEGGTVRNTYAGFSNMLGIMAWDLVKAGFTGERDGVGTIFGTVAASDWTPEEMTRDLGERWEIARNYFKRHAACRYTHGALDALEEIRRRIGAWPTPEAISKIEVDTYVWAAQLDHAAPTNMLAAKFSLPFALATAITHGGASLDAFRDAAREDTATRGLAARVIVREDPALTAKLPGLRPARVTLRLADGRVFTAEVLTNKGDTEDPYSEAEVIAKFHNVADPVVGRERASALVEAVLGLETAENLSTLGTQ